jgi:hypothetical protein
MDISFHDFQYGDVPLQYMLITFLVFTLKRVGIINDITVNGKWKQDVTW